MEEMERTVRIRGRLQGGCRDPKTMDEKRKRREAKGDDVVVVDTQIRRVE
jgi:hypothetical protein